MAWQKEQLKYALISALIGILLWFLINLIYAKVPEYDIGMGPFSVSLSVFLGTFLVLSIIGKLRKPSFSLMVPIFLIYLAGITSIQLIQTVLFFNSVSLHPYFTLSLLLLYQLYNVPWDAAFSLIGIATGIMMVRHTSKVKLDVFYLVLSSLTGAAAGLMIIQFSWIFTYSQSFFALFILTGTLTGAIIQVVRLRKRQTSELQACISVALWIIAFITTLFLLMWLLHRLFPPPIM